MKLGTWTPVAARRWTSLLGACIALMLVTAQWGVGQPADKPDEAKGPKKHELTFKVTYLGSSPQVKKQAKLRQGDALGFHNTAANHELIVGYPPAIFEPSQGQDSPTIVATATDAVAVPGTMTLKPGENGTLTVRNKVPNGTEVIITYKLKELGTDVTIDGGADPIIIVKE